MTLGWQVALSILVLIGVSGVTIKTCLELYDRRQSKQEAEELQRRGQVLIDTGHKNAGVALYAAASTSYWHFITRAFWTIFTDHKKELTLVAQAYKGLADVETRRAELTGNDELLTKAKANAAAAALLAPSQTFKGSAIAVFGVAAQKSGDPQTAIMAYSTAAKLGYKQPWVERNYDVAFQNRDNVRNASQASDYVAIGRYQTLSEDKLKSFVTNSDILRAISSKRD